MLLAKTVAFYNVIAFNVAPHGQVSQGSKRDFVDNDAIFRMKTAVDSCTEFQIAIVNFHKSGRVI